MAINQRFSFAPNSAPLGILEMMVEPGSPRQFWSGTAWVATPTPIPLTSDTLIVGGFLYQIPTSITSGFADKIYWLYITDPNSPLKDSVIELRPIYLTNGDDGGNALQSITMQLTGMTVGGVATTGNVKFFGASLVAS